MSTPTDSSATLSNPTSATPALTIDQPENYTIALSISDGHVTSTPNTVVVSTINSRLVANAGTGQGGQVGDVITLDGSNSSDVDGDSLTYQWSLITQPATSTATLQNPTTVTLQFTLDKAGTYVVQLSVDDGTVSSDPATVTISTLNSAPVAELDSTVARRQFGLRFPHSSS